MVLEPIAQHGSIFRIRELLIRQRTQAINALPGHLVEFGEVAPKGAANISGLIALVEDTGTPLPEMARGILSILLATLSQLGEKIAALDGEIERRAQEDATARRLMTIPPLGQVNMPCRPTGYWPIDRQDVILESVLVYG